MLRKVAEDSLRGHDTVGFDVVLVSFWVDEIALRYFSALLRFHEGSTTISAPFWVQ
jgi:hypothetical protein